MFVNGLCWQIVPRNIGELISHPKAMEAMMRMIKMDLPALEAGAREKLRASSQFSHKRLLVRRVPSRLDDLTQGIIVSGI